jgi:hypothetical protein
MTPQSHTLERLRNSFAKANIAYDERTVRDGYQMLEVAVPGQRWEIEVDLEGNIEFEVFRSSGEIFDEKELVDAIAKFADS